MNIVARTIWVHCIKDNSCMWVVRNTQEPNDLEQKGGWTKTKRTLKPLLTLESPESMTLWYMFKVRMTSRHLSAVREIIQRSNCEVLGLRVRGVRNRMLTLSQCFENPLCSWCGQSTHFSAAYTTQNFLEQSKQLLTFSVGFLPKIDKQNKQN